jgi:CDP-2,3-bis-(O-geranylgeranyl)-sn-glycerol synthase
VSETLRDVLFVLWVFIPAGVANMVPIFAAHIPSLRRFDTPIDMGKTFRGRRIFGDHKTWRGLLTGMLAATVVLALQQLLVGRFSWFAWLADGLDYAALPTLLVGPLFGLGALGGDAIKSFFKRQVGVEPGKSWFPFDQVDYIIGGALAVLPFIHFTALQYVLLTVVWLSIHVLSTYIGWLLKLKDQPI